MKILVDSLVQIQFGPDAGRRGRVAGKQSAAAGAVDLWFAVWVWGERGWQWRDPSDLKLVGEPDPDWLEKYKTEGRRRARQRACAGRLGELNDGVSTGSGV